MEKNDCGEFVKSVMLPRQRTWNERRDSVATTKLAKATAMKEGRTGVEEDGTAAKCQCPEIATSSAGGEKTARVGGSLSFFPSRVVRPI